MDKLEVLYKELKQYKFKLRIYMGENGLEFTIKPVQRSQKEIIMQTLLNLSVEAVQAAHNYMIADYALKEDYVQEQAQLTKILYLNLEFYFKTLIKNGIDAYYEIMMNHKNFFSQLYELRHTEIYNGMAFRIGGGVWVPGGYKLNDYITYDDSPVQCFIEKALRTA